MQITVIILKTFQKKTTIVLYLEAIKYGILTGLIIHTIRLLRFCQEKKRISYAASFGVDSIPEKWIEKYRKGLSEFRYLSVREKAAVKIVTDIIGKPCNMVLDPTMLLNKSEWDKIAKVSTRIKRKNISLHIFSVENQMKLIKKYQNMQEDMNVM